MQKHHAIAIFWEKYISKTKCYLKNDKSIQWYVKHVENYIKKHPSQKLKTHTPLTLECYFNELGRKRLIDWQFQQTIKALRILFVDVVKSDWALDFPWGFWLDSCRELEQNHPSVAKDGSLADALPKHCQYSGLSKKIIPRFPGIFEHLIKEIRVRQYSIRTEQVYVSWMTRFITFHDGKNPLEYCTPMIKPFLDDLAVNRSVAASTQNQALNAIIFFFRHVLNKEPGQIGDFVFAKKPRRLPVVLSVQEVRALIDAIDNATHHLMASLLYGCGMRLMECFRLRCFDIDFDYKQIIVRDTKGKKDRVVPLPVRLQKVLTGQLNWVANQHQKDLANGYGEVYLPDALARKYPNAAKESGWQYVFPSVRLSVDPRSAKVRRHHIHENSLQKQIKRACAKARIMKKVNCHCLRHYQQHRIMLSKIGKPLRPSDKRGFQTILTQHNYNVCKKLRSESSAL